MNRKIVVSVVIITAAGIANAWTNSKPITGVVIGSYILLLVLSILDMFGGPLSTLSGAIAMVAVVYVLLHEFPWQTLINLAQGKKS